MNTLVTNKPPERNEWENFLWKQNEKFLETKWCKRINSGDGQFYENIFFWIDFFKKTFSTRIHKAFLSTQHSLIKRSKLLSLHLEFITQQWIERATKCETIFTKRDENGKEKQKMKKKTFKYLPQFTVYSSLNIFFLQRWRRRRQTFFYHF